MTNILTVDSTPKNLLYHVNDIENIYTFYWDFDDSLMPTLSACSWELQISTDSTFVIPGDIYLKGPAGDTLGFHDGNPVKGVDITIPGRTYAQEQELYARVRTWDGSTFSAYSNTLAFTIYEDYKDTYAENLLTIVPDAHVYDKDPLLLPVAQRTTNLYSRIFKMYGANLDAMKLQLIKMKLDQGINIGRDESLYDNFGAYFDFEKPAGMDYVQYRYVLKAIFNSLFYSGTEYSIKAIVRAFTGIDPTIENIRDAANFYIYDTLTANSSYVYDSAHIPTPPSPIIYTRGSMGFGIIIDVNNTAGFTIDITMQGIIYALLQKTIPAHIFFELTT
jgi:hypothetical protein